MALDKTNFDDKSFETFSNVKRRNFAPPAAASVFEVNMLSTSATRFLLFLGDRMHNLNFNFVKYNQKRHNEQPRKCDFQVRIKSSLSIRQNFFSMNADTHLVVGEQAVKWFWLRRYRRVEEQQNLFWTS